MKYIEKTKPKIKRKVRIGAEHRDKDGNLISYAETRKGVLKEFLERWDGWRMNYCGRHRRDNLPDGFREGRVTPYVMVWSYFTRRKDAREAS